MERDISISDIKLPFTSCISFRRRRDTVLATIDQTAAACDGDIERQPVDAFQTQYEAFRGPNERKEGEWRKEKERRDVGETR